MSPLFFIKGRKRRVCTSILRLLFLTLCVGGLLTDWVLFSNCTPLYHDEPVVCDSIPWPERTFSIPRSLPGAQANSVGYFRFFELSNSGKLSGFGYSPDGKPNQALGFVYSIEEDSLHWISLSKPFFAIVEETPHSWLGCQGAATESNGPRKSMAALYEPPSECHPGKWVSSPQDSFVPYEMPENLSCIIIGVIQDSLTWGACKPKNSYSANEVTTMFWSGTQMAHEWTDQYKNRLLIDVKLPWLLTRTLQPVSSTWIYRISLGKWETQADAGKPLPDWATFTNAFLRQDGQIASYVTNIQLVKGRWYILDSTLTDITPEDWKSAQSTEGPFSNLNISHGIGEQWIFATPDGRLETISPNGKIVSSQLPTQPFQFTDFYVANNYCLAVLRGTQADCQMRTGLFPFQNPFP
jgi:hypothetical protein